LISLCAECGAQLPAGVGFCPACGAPAAPRRALVGEERKVVTALFADLVDFTSHAELLDPEDVRGLLSPYFTRLRAEIERFGGTVEKFIGDAVMALFGAPVAHEDDPERAVRAALAVRDAVVELNERTPEVDLHVRVGVNTGEALVAIGASPTEGEGMASGDVVNTSFRLQAAAPVDGILVGETTYRATATTFDYRPKEPVHAKGKREPVPVWEPLGLLSRTDAAAPPPSPLVGRSQELDLLLTALARVRRERTTQLVSLIGVPGIGKTRLVRELLEAAEDDPDPVTCLRGRSLPYGESMSFAALADMAKSQARILRTDVADTAASKLRGALDDLFPDAGEARWVESQLRPLVGLDEPRRLPQDARAEAFGAWRRFFEALANRRGAVIVFEDLHWADDGLLDFIDHLADWAGSCPLFVICTARPELLERRPGWGGGKRNAATVSLAPLTDDEIGQLVGALLEQRALPEEVEAPLLASAGGNPLYAEEYARMLRDQDFLTVGGALRGLPLPHSVQGIIAARIDALSAEEKRALHAAAIVGKSAWTGAVAALAELERPAAEETLHALERKEFLRREHRSSVADEIEYSFHHVLLHDVAYAQIPRPRRAAGHEHAAEWIESLSSDREDQIELLAHHYLRALELSRTLGTASDRLIERARTALREAGDRATALNAHGSAARFYEATLDLCPDDDPEQARDRFRLGRALFHQGAGAEMLEEAREGLLAVGDKASAAEAEALLGVLAAREARAKTALGHVKKAAELLADAPPSPPKAKVIASLAGILMTAEPEEAIRLGSETLVMAEELQLDDLRAHALTTIGFARGTTGDDGGVDDLEQAVAIAETVSSPETIRSHAMLAAVLDHQGDLRRAAEVRERAWRAADRFWNPMLIRFLESERVAESYWSGRWDDAVRVADDFVEQSEKGARHYGEILCRQMRAEIRLARGDHEGALDDATRGLDRARRTGHPQSLYPALAIAGRILLLAGEGDEAGRHADELLRQWRRAPSTPPSFWVTDVAIVLTGLDRGEELAALAKTGSSTRWLAAASALLVEPAHAVELYREIGSRPDEAYARVRTAQALLGERERAQAERQLDQALAFYRGVGAEAYVQEAERLVGASA